MQVENVICISNTNTMPRFFFFYLKQLCFNIPQCFFSPLIQNKLYTSNFFCDIFIRKKIYILT
ncbi:hypothetical protein GYH30_050722 [Glycine max]|uniref:Uncharacterized protein n=1 Tax=Glycine max TaxID=3847 RepID=A0A0R0FBK3_SOYBN|nr:hypothetical protein GYH30_050722 [Glycine max]